MLSWFQRYLMPGLVFESVVIGGGYATGREIVEFFLKYGPMGGLFGMLATLVVWGIVLAVSFEFARMTRSYDYRAFFKHLLGPGWVLFEVLYYATLVLVLWVIGAACGALFEGSFGLPGLYGTGLMMCMIGLFVYFGSSLIERALSLWAILLYVLYGTLVFWCVTRYGDVIANNLAHSRPGHGWIVGGIAYAGYNLASVPTVLFCLRHVTRRREAVLAGLIGGPAAILPGILFYFCVLAFYPAIQQQAIPSVYIIQRLGSPAFALIFQIALFGTLVKTGIGLLHALNERLANAFVERQRRMPRLVRPLASLGILTFSVVLAERVGVVDLIARGYGTITYAFLLVFVLPIMTIGLWRIVANTLHQKNVRTAPTTL